MWLHQYVGDLSTWSPKQQSVPPLMRRNPRQTVGQRWMPWRQQAASRCSQPSPRCSPTLVQSRCCISQPCPRRSVANHLLLPVGPLSPRSLLSWLLHSGMPDLATPRCAPTWQFGLAALRSKWRPLRKADCRRGHLYLSLPSYILPPYRRWTCAF